MCGIFGLVESEQKYCTVENLNSMVSLLSHRGPDDFGTDLWSGGVGFPVVGCAFRRLAVVDVTQAAHQPMVSGDGRHRLVFNGEIYNYKQLRAKLEQRGYRFTSTGDTQVLLAALAEWGIEVIPELEGMFAFAWLDTEARTLTLARDAFGIKPLFWSTWKEGFAYSSEIPPLLAHPAISRRPNASAIHDYLRFGITAHNSSTMFADVQQLLPGSYVTIKLNKPTVVEIERWWQPRRTGPIDIPIDVAASTLREMFLESVADHLRSDVPLGAALSGGIDSSGIVGAVRAVQPEDVDLHVFSFVTKEPGLDEEQWIELAAREARATLHKVHLSSGDLRDQIDDLLRAQVEPIGGTSVFAQYRVFQKAADEGIKVMLDGQGPDEMFGGYRSHLTFRGLTLLRSGNFGEALDLFRSAARLPGGETVARVVARGILTWMPLGAADRLRQLSERRGPLGAINYDWFLNNGVSTGVSNQTQEKELLAETLRTSIAETSLPQLLRYEDRNSMHWSIESRVPYLTTKIADFALSLPEDYYVTADGTSKAVLRRALIGITPDPILDRKDKIGYSVPEGIWLSAMDSWVRDVLDSSPAESPLFKPELVRDYWQHFDPQNRGYVEAMWRILNLIRWAELFSVKLN